VSDSENVYREKRRGKEGKGGARRKVFWLPPTNKREEKKREKGGKKKKDAPIPHPPTPRKKGGRADPVLFALSVLGWPGH